MDVKVPAMLPYRPIMGANIVGDMEAGFVFLPSATSNK
jgi:hypothetical protein